MSVRVAGHVRQWVSLPGGSCDMRIGDGLLDEAGTILKGAVGLPQLAALVTTDGIEPALVEHMRRQLVSVGFDVRAVGMPGGAASRRSDSASALASRLGEVAITSDDLVVALGDADELSAVASVAGAWYGGVTLAAIPTSLNAAVSAIATPRGIDVGIRREALAVRGCARYALCDPRVMLRAGTDELAHAQMVAIAMCESERAFGVLWDHAAAMASGDSVALCAQLAASAKGRGQVASSNSVAIRSSCAYGMTFARSLGALAPGVAPGVALAEGLRFCARLAAGMDLISVDDVLAQDELLDTLGIGLAACEVEARRLVDAIQADRFLRTNRLMLELPRALGRVRLATVDAGLMLEHAEAWCAARADAGDVEVAQ